MIRLPSDVADYVLWAAWSQAYPLPPQASSRCWPGHSLCVPRWTSSWLLLGFNGGVNSELSTSTSDLGQWALYVVSPAPQSASSSERPQLRGRWGSIFPIQWFGLSKETEQEISVQPNSFILLQVYVDERAVTMSNNMLGNTPPTGILQWAVSGWPSSQSFIGRSVVPISHGLSHSRRHRQVRRHQRHRLRQQRMRLH